MRKDGYSLFYTLIYLLLLTIAISIIFKYYSSIDYYYYRSKLLIEDRYIQQSSFEYVSNEIYKDYEWEYLEVRDTLLSRIGDFTISNIPYGLFPYVSIEYDNSHYYHMNEYFLYTNIPDINMSVLYLLNENSKLDISGNTIINGDLHTGPFGVDSVIYKGNSFNGALKGDLYMTKSLDSLIYRDDYYNWFKKYYKAQFDLYAVSISSMYQILQDSSSGVKKLIYTSENMGEYININLKNMNEPIILELNEEHSIIDDSKFPAFSVIYSNDDIEIINTELDSLVIFSKGKVVVENSILNDVQILSDSTIEIKSSNIINTFGVIASFMAETRSSSFDYSVDIINSDIRSIVYSKSNISEDSKNSIKFDSYTNYDGLVYSNGSVDVNFINQATILSSSIHFYDTPTFFGNLLYNKVLEPTSLKPILPLGHNSMFNLNSLNKKNEIIFKK